MTAIEDPAQLSSEAAAADRPSDDLEHWLSDLRTDVAADPPGWITQDAAGESPDRPAEEHSPLPPSQPETGPAEPSSGGRHRAAD
jgi:hypothetical protein